MIKLNDKNSTTLNINMINVLGLVQCSFDQCCVSILGSDTRRSLSYNSYEEAVKDIEDLYEKCDFYKIEGEEDRLYYINPRNIMAIPDPFTSGPLKDKVHSYSWNLNIHFTGLNMSFAVKDLKRVYKDLTGDSSHGDKNWIVTTGISCSEEIAAEIHLKTSELIEEYKDKLNGLGFTSMKLAEDQDEELENVVNGLKLF